jgi:hypothetical protein
MWPSLDIQDSYHNLDKKNSRILLQTYKQGDEIMNDMFTSLFHSN